MPQLTFVIPCYNYARYLRACADSICAQSFTDCEMLIVDDTSTDETPDIAKTLTAEDARIRYHRHEQNIGHIANFNYGIERANGELVWLISADDCLKDPGIVQEFVTQFRNNPKLGFAFCRVQCIEADSTPYDKYIPRAGHPKLPTQPGIIPGQALFEFLIRENFVASPGAIARKACYERIGYFKPELTHSGDWYNWLAFALDWDVFYEPEAKVYYRKHRQNLHLTYADPNHTRENSLLCYTVLEQFMRTRKDDPKLIRQLQLARVQFMKKYEFPMTLPQKLTRLYGKLTGQYS